jgi:Endonuclease/Exonuclease/phosphatase family
MCARARVWRRRSVARLQQALAYSRRVQRGAVVLGVLLAIACGAPDGAEDSGPGPDAGFEDAGHDGGVAPQRDSGPDLDAGPNDDAGTPDAGAPDGGALDAGQPDAGADGGGGADSGSGDAGGVDSGTVDAGPDAGRFDAGDGTCAASATDAGAFLVRVVAANLTSGNLQSYDPLEGQRILQGLRPDVVLIQEFNFGNNTTATLQAFVDATTFDAGFAWSRGAGQIPNGVLSRWPIAASGEWIDPQVSNRTFAWARIDLPGPRDLWAVSVHLLTSNPNQRDLEARALLQRLEGQVPRGDLVVVGGDFNTDVRTEICFATLLPRLVTNGDEPADLGGNTGTNRNRTKPYDQVLASPCLRALQAPVQIGANRFDAGLVFDTRTYDPLADVAPAQAGDSAAVGMQHMAVVKDFAVQP